MIDVEKRGDRLWLDPKIRYFDWKELLLEICRDVEADARREAIEQAAKIVDTWHISKGGYCELAAAVRELK